MAVLFGAMVLAGCSGNSAATINVKVMKDGKPVVGEMVYMYRGSLQDSFLQHKIHSSMQVATDDSGVAEFKLSSGDFGFDSTLSFNFETFDSNENVNGKVAASVNKGQSKDVTITQF